MASSDTASIAEGARLSRERREAGLYEQKLRERIVAIRDRLAAGHGSRAVAINQALNDIDSATDVVAPSKPTNDESVVIRFKAGST
jgi:hypothetical protein